VLERIRETGTISQAWSDQPWVNEGVVVRVSLVAFGRDAREQVGLDGKPVAEIHADLTGRALDANSGTDLTQAQALKEHTGVMFMGASQKGSLDIPGELAR
jgi:hypothetical protein